VRPPQASKAALIRPIPNPSLLRPLPSLNLTKKQLEKI
jgi:hypothetical protein